jgi:hypothetical protein
MIALCGRIVRVGVRRQPRALPAWWLLCGGLPAAISAEFLDWLDMDGRGKLASSTQLQHLCWTCRVFGFPCDGVTFGV